MNGVRALSRGTYHAESLSEEKEHTGLEDSGRHARGKLHVTAIDYREGLLLGYPRQRRLLAIYIEASWRIMGHDVRGS